jgi:hypothetical protein
MPAGGGRQSRHWRGIENASSAHREFLCCKPDTEIDMPTLTENTVFIDLAPGKAKGLSLTELGVPLTEGTQIKKGRINEFLQLMEDETVGRRYQNIRATVVKAAEGGEISVKFFLQFEVFGDDNTPVAGNSGVVPALLAGGELLLELPASPAFLPYAGSWYENQFVYDMPADLFGRISRIQLKALPDDVRLI